MKKNVLALSITAALVGLGYVSSAQAIVAIPPGTATELRVSPNGIGHFLLVPYYTVQGGNTTLINIVNTDTQNGKAVKVRFRGASNSDDVFDFQVFLSPSDVWTASLGMNVNGLAQLHTDDLSCTKPSKANINATPFVTQRLDTSLSSADLANQTREGYVEIFTMADIPSGTSLFTAIKHVPNGAPPCGSGTQAGVTAAWNALDTDLAGLSAATSAGLNFPSTGLMGGWIILNVNDAGAWSQIDTAIVANIDPTLRTPATGNLVYFPQTQIGFSNLAPYTADPYLLANPGVAAMYDIPDFSVPYLSNTATPSLSVSALTSAIATTKVYNEFLTKSSINSTTDWTLSMPTRRYWVAYDYALSSIEYNLSAQNTWFTSANITQIANQLCVTGITPTSYDQEENTPAGSGTIISPGKAGLLVFCGEANVMSVNNGEHAGATGLITTPSGVLKATVARSAIDNGYTAGWIALSTPGISKTNSVGLPILGDEVVRATAAPNTFGATWEHRFNRSQH